MPGHSDIRPAKLMRHADIRTTMNTYGDVVTDAGRPPPAIAFLEAAVVESLLPAE
jgi:hypothetical protein